MISYIYIYVHVYKRICIHIYCGFVCIQSCELVRQEKDSRISCLFEYLHAKVSINHIHIYTNNESCMHMHANKFGQ